MQACLRVFNTKREPYASTYQNKRCQRVFWLLAHHAAKWNPKNLKNTQQDAAIVQIARIWLKRLSRWVDTQRLRPGARPEPLSDCPENSNAELLHKRETKAGIAHTEPGQWWGGAIVGRFGRDDFRSSQFGSAVQPNLETFYTL